MHERLAAGPTVQPLPRHIRAAGMPVAGLPAGDRQLLRAAALGDESAWLRLVDAHAATVWRDVLAAQLPAADAHAVSETVWLRLAESLPLSTSTPLSQWLREVTATEVERALAVRADRSSHRWDGVERRRQHRGTG